MPKRVTVILSDDEYAHVRRLAGMVPLSAWFRGLALGAKWNTRSSEREIQLSTRDFKSFLTALDSDEEPNEKLRALAEKWREG